MVKHDNTQTVFILLVLAMGCYYANIEYGITLTKPAMALGGFVLLKLWLRRVNTATYILFHVVLLGGGFLWVKSYLDKMSSMDLFTTISTILAEAGAK